MPVQDRDAKSTCLQWAIITRGNARHTLYMCLTNASEARHPIVPSMRKKPAQYASWLESARSTISPHIHIIQRKTQDILLASP